MHNSLTAESHHRELCVCLMWFSTCCVRTQHKPQWTKNSKISALFVNKMTSRKNHIWNISMKPFIGYCEPEVLEEKFLCRPYFFEQRNHRGTTPLNCRPSWLDIQISCSLSPIRIGICSCSSTKSWSSLSQPPPVYQTFQRTTIFSVARQITNPVTWTYYHDGREIHQYDGRRLSDRKLKSWYKCSTMKVINLLIT